MDGWEAPVNGREQRGGDVCTWSDDRSDQELQPSVRFAGSGSALRAGLNSEEVHKSRRLRHDELSGTDRQIRPEICAVSPPQF